jgi:dTMP kinase
MRLGLRYTRAVASDRARGRGWFLTIEGPEGAGKTTQAERLREWLSHAGFDVVLTREPGGTPVGERVREILLDPGAAHDPRTDALLFNAARAALVHDVIEPAIRRGAVVISTRFSDSTIAYQGHGAGLSIDQLRRVEAFATDGLRPDLTILIDVPAEVGLERKDAERTRFESSFTLEFHERVRAGFLALAAAEPERFAVVDGMAPLDDVAREILTAVGRRPGLNTILAGVASEPERVAPRIYR